MTRDEFVAMACAMGMRSVENPAVRSQHVEHLVATANATAEALGLWRPRAPEDGEAEQHRLRANETEARVKLLEGMVRERDERIDALSLDLRKAHEELDAATTPAAKPARGGRTG